MVRRRSMTWALATVAALLPFTTAWGQAHFLRGDANHDKGTDISDPVQILSFLFTGAAAPPCRDAADFNDDGQINITDAIAELQWLFLGEDPPAAPYPKFEGDPTSDDPLGCLGPPIVLTGDITSDMTLTRDNVYLLEDGAFVKDGVTLTIQEGTTIIGDSTTEGLLVIERGGRLVAVGTETHPVVFTSNQPVGSRARGDWGGLIILGNGDNNLPGKQGLAEGLENTFWGGGDNVIADEDSGRLSFVRVEYGGTEISMDNEVNAISMFGVGSGTRFDHVQTKYNLDDGFEWFGGAANLKYGLAVGIGDDSFDYSFGWSGRGQFWVAQQRADDADRGFEVDNSEDEFGARPLTRPTISNVTLIGAPGGDSDTGLMLRRGAGTELYNAIVTGFNDAGLDLDESITTENIETGDLIVDYVIFHGNNEPFETGEVDTEAETPENGFTMTTAAFGDPTLPAGDPRNPNNVLLDEGDPSPIVQPFDLDSPNFRPQNVAETSGFNPASLGEFFDAAPYFGGVPPEGEGEDWTQARWISFLQN